MTPQPPSSFRLALRSAGRRYGLWTLGLLALASLAAFGCGMVAQRQTAPAPVAGNAARMTPPLHAAAAPAPVTSPAVQRHGKNPTAARRNPPLEVFATFVEADPRSRPGGAYAGETGFRVGGAEWFRGPGLITLLAMGPAPLAVAGQIVRVGVFQDRPKIFTDAHGQPAGVFVDVLREIARRERWDIRYVTGTWEEGLAALHQDRIDLMPDVAFSAQRLGNYGFARESVLATWWQVFAGARLPLESILDLGGKRIALPRGSAPERDMAGFARRYGLAFTVIPCASADEAFGAVASGRADVAIADRFAGLAIRERGPVLATAVLIDPATLHFVAWPGRHHDWLAAIDRDLAALKADRGSGYYVALNRWLGGARSVPMPGWIRGVLGAGAVLLVLFLIAIAVIERRLKARSAQLAVEHERLHLALKDLKQAHADMLRSERRHTAEHIAAGIAHDLNNVVTPILGFVEFLLVSEKNRRDEASLRRALEGIGEAARDGARAVTRMRSFYDEHEPLEMKRVVVSGLLADLEDLSEPLVKGRAVTVKLMAEPVPPVHGNAAALREAFLALILNAIEAMPDGGILRLKSAKAGALVSIAIEDTGTGMDAETLQHCRRPFFTTKRTSGAGMGLATAASIVERHGGTLLLTSAPGQGTCATVMLPAAVPGKDGTKNGVHHHPVAAGHAEARPHRAAVS